MTANGGHSPIQVSSPRRRVGLPMRHPNGEVAEGHCGPAQRLARASATLEPVFVQIDCGSVAAVEQVELCRRLWSFVVEEVPGGEPLTGTYPLLKTSSVRELRVAVRSMGQSAVNTTRNRALLFIIR